MNPEDVPRDEFKEWAERNGYNITTPSRKPEQESETSELIAIGQGGQLEIILSKYGNILLC